jgi:hypothetical protein
MRSYFRRVKNVDQSDDVCFFAAVDKKVHLLEGILAYSSISTAYEEIVIKEEEKESATSE